MQIDKVYEPQRFEPHWAQWWIDSGVFETDDASGAPMYSLVIPPPNVTGSLHMGHMLEHTEMAAAITLSKWEPTYTGPRGPTKQNRLHLCAARPPAQGDKRCDVPGC